jgi:hypothetical protein
MHVRSSSVGWLAIAIAIMLVRRRCCAQAGLPQRVLVICRVVRGDEALKRGVLLLQQAAFRLRNSHRVRRNRCLRLHTAQALIARADVGVHVRSLVCQ